MAQGSVQGTRVYPEPVITPCTTPVRDLAFPCLSPFTHTVDLLYCFPWRLLQNRSNPAEKSVLKAQG